MEPKPYARLAQLEDAKSLAPRLRVADWIELDAAGHEPERTLSEACAHGAYAIVLNDQVEGMFGCVPCEDDPEHIGYPWLLGSDAMGKNPIRIQFLRESKVWLEAMHERYPVLVNAVWEENTLHLRWLEWLGFDTSTKIENYNGSRKIFRLVMSRRGV